MTMNHHGGKMPPTNFSIDEAIKIRSEAFAAIRVHAATITTIGAAIEQLDETLQRSISLRGNDDRHALVIAAQHLASLLNDREVNG